MSIATMFGFGVKANPADLPKLYPLNISAQTFIDNDVIHIFQKILTDVVERTQGIPENRMPLLWDSCLKSSLSDGLITMLAKAMAEKKELFLVIKNDVLRKATQTEEAQIKADYEKSAKSSVGIYISFKEFIKADFLKVYSTLELCTIEALNKQMNLAKAIQFKVSALRTSVSLIDASKAESQAVTIATALNAGKPVLLDEKDEILLLEPNIDPVKQAIEFFNQKRAYYLGLPAAYIMGEQTGGLNADGGADQKATERGLKNFYVSIVQPTVEALFGKKVEYKSQDDKALEVGLNTMKTFEMTSEDFVTLPEKQGIVRGILGLPKENPELPKEREPDVLPAGPGQPQPGKAAPAPKGNA